MADSTQSGATGDDGSVAAAPVIGTGDPQSEALGGQAPAASRDERETRRSIWGGHRSGQSGRAPDPAGDGAPKPLGAMAEAVRLAREAARHEWLRIIPDDPNERQRIADDLRP